MSYFSIRSSLYQPDLTISPTHLPGEVERDGDVCNFEPHEVVEIWQSPVSLAKRLVKNECFFNSMTSWLKLG